jgi:hypothetical protein
MMPIKSHESQYTASSPIDSGRRCGFCSKSEYEDSALIQAAIGYICNECVQICADVIKRNEPSTATPTEAAEVDRLTSELKAVQERAASEISELAVTVIDLKFELYNAGFEIEHLNAEVERLRNQRDSARANAIDEAINIASSHKHVSACDAAGCKQVIAAALESLKQKQA